MVSHNNEFTAEYQYQLSSLSSMITTASNLPTSLSTSPTRPIFLESVNTQILVKESLQAAEHQIAGHQKDQRKGRKGFLVDKEAKLIYKTITKAAAVDRLEVKFYEDYLYQFAPSMVDYVPKFFGVQTIQDEEGLSEYEVQQDVTADHKRPCTMDIKIGTQSPKSYNKYPLQKNVGFRISGMEVYRNETKETIKHNKYDCNVTCTEQAKSLLLQYFYAGNYKFRIDAIKSFIQRVEELKKVMERVTTFRFYGSSLFLVYEGHTGQQEGTENSDGGEQDHCILKIIDFTHLDLIPESTTPDDGVINSLERIIQDLRDILVLIETSESLHPLVKSLSSITRLRSKPIRTTPGATPATPATPTAESSLQWYATCGTPTL